MKKRALSALLILAMILCAVPLAGLTVLALDDVTIKSSGLKLQNPALPASETNPYLINSVDDWILFADIDDFQDGEGAYFLLTTDLDFSGRQKVDFDGYINTDCIVGFSCDFTGVFDGGGHKISGLKIEAALSPATALFREVIGATIKNLTLEKCVMTTTNGQYAGGIVGKVLGKDTKPELMHTIVENCVVDKDCVISNTKGNAVTRIGGIVADMPVANNSEKVALTIRNCICMATLESTARTGSGNTYFGGILGDSTNHRAVSSNTLVIENCVSMVTVKYPVNKPTGNLSIGGLVGELSVQNAQIRNCWSDLKVEANWAEGAEGKENTYTMPAVGGAVGVWNRANGSNEAATEAVISDSVMNATLTGTAASIFKQGCVAGTVGIGSDAEIGVKASGITIPENGVVAASAPVADGKKLTEENISKVSAVALKEAGNRIAVGAVPAIMTCGTASVKIASEAVDLRFSAMLNAPALAVLRDVVGDSLAVAEYGLLIAASEVVSAADRFAEDAMTEGSYQKVVSAESDSNGWFKNTPNRISGKTNVIATADQNKNYVAIGFVKLTYTAGDGTVTVVNYAGNTSGERSVQGVAQAAYEDTGIAYSDEQRAIFKALAGITA